MYLCVNVSTPLCLPFLGHPPQEQLKQKLPLAFSHVSFKSTALASIREIFPCHLGQRSALQNQQCALLRSIISPTLPCTLTPFPTGQRRDMAQSTFTFVSQTALPMPLGMAQGPLGEGAFMKSSTSADRAGGVGYTVPRPHHTPAIKHCPASHWQLTSGFRAVFEK